MLNWQGLQKQLRVISRKVNKQRSKAERRRKRGEAPKNFESLEKRMLLSSSLIDDAALMPAEDDPTAVQVIVDNRDADHFSRDGRWWESYTADEYDGSSYYSTRADDTATWTPELPEEGLYDVYVWVSGQHANGYQYDRDSLAQYDVTYAGGTSTVVLNQDDHFGEWTKLDQFYFNADGTESVTVTASGSDRHGTSADAVRWVKVDTPPIVVSSTQVQVPEGGSATFAVQLDKAPPNETTVTITKTGGDSDLSADVSVITFDATNWDKPQLVTISAAVDGDAESGTATFLVEAGGLESQTVVAYEFNARVQHVQGLKYWQFNTLSEQEVAYLTAEQIANIPHGWWLTRINAAGRDAMSADQVQAINLNKISLRYLTETQRSKLSAEQIQSLNSHDLRYLNASQIQHLTTEQVASLPNAWAMTGISEDARNAMTEEQVQAINLQVVPVRYLTQLQREKLSTEQIQSLNWRDFGYLNESQVPKLTTDQIASIPNSWWFTRISEASRDAMTAEQIQALNLRVVTLNYLSQSQRDMLSVEQIQSLTWREFGYLTPQQVPHLTTQQIASIPNGWTFKRMSEEARAALTEEQVQAINISAIPPYYLTDAQKAMLSVSQVQSLHYHHFDHLSADQIVHLTTAQLAGIPNEWSFTSIPEEVRSALTETQIQALNMAVVRLRGLTAEQVDMLSKQQIQTLRYSDFGYLDESQIIYLTPSQMATIPNSYYFNRIEDSVRALLSPEQVQQLNTAKVSIRYLTPLQRQFLSVAQIQTISSSDFRYLSSHQVPYLTTAQMSKVTSTYHIKAMQDESENALTRTQLLALPDEIYSRLSHGSHTPDDAPMSSAMSLAMAMMDMDDEHDHDDGHDHDDDNPHPDDPGKHMEHMALFDLVKHENATHTTIASGLWSDATIWASGEVPDADANVVIAADMTVIFDEIITGDAINTVRVDGVLQFATDIDTQLLVDTLVVDTEGLLRIGTEDNPVESGVAARIVIADGDLIDPEIDPLQLGKGVISHGAVEVYGQEVTPYVSLNVDPMRGDTQLVLDEVPTNWNVGDRLVLTGTNPYMNHNQDEELEIVAIDGNVVTIDQPLEYNHQTPDGYDLKVYVANVNRNVVFMSERPDVNALRGHVMFMHNQDVQVHNAGFYGMGRSDKRNPSNDAEFDHDGNLIEGTGLNQRGRYSVHFHRAGDSASNTPGVVTGSAVVDSPGWGFVNHDSYVVMEDNVAFNVVGASFVTEFGNEIGAFRRNLSIHTTGSGDGLEEREDIFDFGHNGHGFWMQGPGVELEDNISVSNNDAAFIFFTSSSMAEFDADNLDDPSLAGGRDSLPVGSVPIKLFKGNTAFASENGLETWFHLLRMNDAESVFEDFTAWGMRRNGSHNPYTNNAVFQDFLLIGNEDRPRGTGFSRNGVSRSFTYDNVEVVGFSVGIDVPVNGSTVINNGKFAAVQAIRISGTHDTMRTVDINGDVDFVELSESALRGRQQFKIYMNSEIDPENTDLHTLFSPDIVRLGLVTLNGKQIYYHKQAADYVLFTAENAPDFVPPELIGKTNQQLWDQYGIAPAGTLAAADAVEIDGINGLVGSPADYQPQLQMLSARFTNQVDGYQLRYIDDIGNLVVDDTPEQLREGWNLLTRMVNGQKQTFFVFGDTTAPEFVPDASRPLVVNPRGLQFGFVVHGHIIDAGVPHGRTRFRMRFNTLEGMPILTRPDGTQFILLQFEIRDRAGNTTSVSLEVTLDPNAPIVPGTGQRDLPELPVSKTLQALLNDYLIKEV